MKNECVGIWGRVFGHNYRIIYEEKKDTSRVPTIESIETKGGVKAKEFFESYSVAYTSTEKTYKHSICSRCGDMIK
ncbi:MAG: hypothetical protein ACXABY_13360 [Candidatus Thorarchaeota archaeon]|jgi:hypothetical protein